MQSENIAEMIPRRPQSRHRGANTIERYRFAFIPKTHKEKYFSRLFSSNFGGLYPLCQDFLLVLPTYAPSEHHGSFGASLEQEVERVDVHVPYEMGICSRKNLNIKYQVVISQGWKTLLKLDYVNRKL